MLTFPPSERTSVLRRYYRPLVVSAVCALVLLMVAASYASFGPASSASAAAPITVAVPMDPLLARARTVCEPVRHECSRRLTWAELGAILAAGTPQYISRLTDSQRVYAEARLDMAREFESVSDAVRAHKFGAPCVRAEDGRKRCAFADGMTPADHRALTDASALPDSVVVPNDFPYALESPIAHQVVWTRVPLHGDPARVESLIARHFPRDRFRWQYLVNPPDLQTIKDIFHAHVFVVPIDAVLDSERGDGVQPE